MYVFISFRDPERNRSLGCVITKAISPEDGINKLHRLGINPGGEVLGFMMDEEQRNEQNMELDTLYTREQMIELGYHVGI